ncbi:hypothetical protein LCGC14_1251860 [marine sediment metagenome]|uniref:DUF937 domain-containing protein n=1 Tax=marine sediment metagenome TaxID=412755 RepID=A0A0F9L6A8_9ZZZZ|nr:hypothetical protein [Candidatus Aminicenantes bacterium]
MAFFKGTKEKFQQVPTKTGGQQDFLSQMLANLGQGGLGGQGYEQSIQKLLQIISGEPGAFEAFEAPIKRQFQEETVPGLLEKFSGAGARGSSGMQQTLARAGEGLSEKLGAQRGELQQNAIQQLLGSFQTQAGQALGADTFENVFRPGKQSGFERLLAGLGPAAEAGGEGGMMAMIMKLLPLLMAA